MGKRHTRISRAWQRPGCRGDRDGTGRTLLVGLVLFAWLAATPAAPTSAATSGSASPTTSDVDTPPEYLRAAITLDGKVLFYVRGISSYPAARRAREISEKIRNIAADPSIAPDSLRAVEGAEHTNIVTGDRTVLTVLNSDAELEGIPRTIMAEVARAKIAEAMTAYRIDRSPRVLLINTGYALGATLVLVLLLLALRRLFRWLDTVAERRFKSRIEGLEAQSFQLLQARQLLTTLHTFLKTLSVLSVLVIVYVYLNFVLGLYPWSRPLAQQLFALFLHPLYTIGTAVLSALPNLVFLAILVMMTRYVLRGARFFFAGLDRGTITLANFDRDWALPTYRIIRVLIIAFTLRAPQNPPVPPAGGHGSSHAPMPAPLRRSATFAGAGQASQDRGGERLRGPLGGRPRDGRLGKLDGGYSGPDPSDDYYIRTSAMALPTRHLWMRAGGLPGECVCGFRSSCQERRRWCVRWLLVPKFGRFQRDESALPKRLCGDETTASRHRCLEQYRRDSALSCCYRGGKQGPGYPGRQVRDVALR